MRILYRASTLAFGLLVGCGGGDSAQVCTTIGCFNGLTITLTTPPAGAYRVEAIGSGETTPHAQDCSGVGQCMILFFGYQPATVTISVITGTGTATYNLTPTYTTRPNPNGPGCGPDCRDGVVTVP